MVCSESVLRSRGYLVLLQNCCSFVKKKNTLHSLVFGGRFVTPLFGRLLMQATQPPCKMIEGLHLRCQKRAGTLCGEVMKIIVLTHTMHLSMYHADCSEVVYCTLIECSSCHLFVLYCCKNLLHKGGGFPGIGNW